MSSGFGDSFTPGEQPEEPVVHDRRRLDPETGEVRRPADAGTEPVATGGTDDELTVEQLLAQAEAGDAQDSTALLADAEQRAQGHLDDLQRLQAEYVNYRRRVDRDRDAVKEGAVSSVLEGLLPVLDDIHLARQHGDLAGGPFAAISDKLETALERLGLQRYGDVGEEFDPAVHEALMAGVDESAAAGSPTVITQVLQPGYRVVGTTSRVLRAARVAVAGPA